VLIGATALIGATISTYITVQVVRTDMTNYIEDYLAYGILPGLGYLALRRIDLSEKGLCAGRSS
jgi:xanthine/uracil/vitamin C permease (AzgA family)